MLKNKVIYELKVHLCINKSNKVSRVFINTICEIIHNYMPYISPIYVIETAIFNLLMPVKITYLKNKKYLKGRLIKQIIVSTILRIIKYSKELRTDKSLSYKLAIIFIQVYKKDHFLYKQKLLCLNKMLNL